MLGAKWLTGVAFRGEYENPSHSDNNEVKGFTLTLKHHYNLRNPNFCFNLHFSWTGTYFQCPKYYTHYMQKGMACFSICTFPVLTNTQGKNKHGKFTMTIQLTFYRSCADWERELSSRIRLGTVPGYVETSLFLSRYVFMYKSNQLVVKDLLKSR